MKYRKEGESGTTRLKRSKNYFSAYTRIAINDYNEEMFRKKLSVKKPHPDTVARQEIQNTIITMLRQGKGKLEILNFLNEKYPESSMREHFGEYIENHARKFSAKNTIKEEEER